MKDKETIKLPEAIEVAMTIDDMLVHAAAWTASLRLFREACEKGEFEPLWRASVRATSALTRVMRGDSEVLEALKRLNDACGRVYVEENWDGMSDAARLAADALQGGDR